MSAGLVTPLYRTLEQELLALIRGASLECPACGEFVLHDDGGIVCSECGSRLAKEVGKEAALRQQAG